MKLKYRGKYHHCFKDGRCLRNYYCIDCGKEVSLTSALDGNKRCKKCNKKYQVGKKASNYIDGRSSKIYYCIKPNCNNIVSGVDRRCQRCYHDYIKTFKIIKGRKRSKKTKEKIRQASLKIWKNPKFRKRMAHLFDKKTTSFEQRIIKIINKYNLPFKYVGKGDLIIHGFCPDFVNINGKKQIIEVYANYWKVKDYGSVNKYKKIRKAIFKKYGYNTLFIGEEELKDNNRQIAQRIKNF